MRSTFSKGALHIVGRTFFILKKIFWKSSEKNIGIIKNWYTDLI